MTFEVKEHFFPNVQVKLDFNKTYELKECQKLDYKQKSQEKKIILKNKSNF